MNATRAIESQADQPNTKNKTTSPEVEKITATISQKVYFILSGKTDPDKSVSDKSQNTLLSIGRDFLQ